MYIIIISDKIKLTKCFHQLVVAFVDAVIPLLQNLHLSLTNSP